MIFGGTAAAQSTHTQAAIPESPPDSTNLLAEKKTFDAKSLKESERVRLIFEAVEAGDTEMTDTLANALTYYRHNEQGETALTQAIVQGNADMVRMLTRKAVINLKNQAGETPLTLAIKQGDAEIIALVMQRAKASLKNDQDETPLWLAIENGDLFIAQKLIDKGARVNHLSRGETPIFQAIRTNQLSMLALLIKNGADPSQPNQEEVIPLSLTVQNDQNDLAKVLLRKSHQPVIDANWKNAIGEPLLVQAVKNNNPDMVRLLLENGAQSNETDHLDNTALHMAAKLGYRSVAQVLLENGADTQSRNMLGETPRQLAAGAGHQELLDLFSLRPKGGDSSFVSSYDR